RSRLAAADGGEIAGVAAQAFVTAHSGLRSQADRDPALAGAQCALAVAKVDGRGDTVWIGHIGDVRAYLLRAGSPPRPAAPRWVPPVTLAGGASFVCLTRDHSSVAEMVERGHAEREQVREHPLRTRLTRALGAAPAHEAVIQRVDVAAGDRLLLCSDGLWAALADAELGERLAAAADAEAACAALIEAAGDDDVAVAVLDWPAEARRSSGRTREPAAREPAAGDLPGFARDLTAEALAGRLDPVIGRGAELRRLSQILVQRRKPNPLLVGDAGVGKTALVEGLAQALTAVDRRSPLHGTRIVELALGDLVAGARHLGTFEERLRDLVRRAEADRHLVLFIDELHLLMGAGATGADDPMDAANLLKPALARGSLRVIGATTRAEYERHIARDAALARRFEVIELAEPDRDQALAIVRGLRARLEQHYQLTIADAAVDAAVDLALRHVPERRLPDKAIDLLEAACARRAVGSLTPGKPVAAAPIAVADLVAVLAERYHIPPELIAHGEGERIAGLADHLGERILGQEAAVAAVARTLERARAGIGDPRRPLASFLFLGPTGVGKTECARAVAEYLFGAGSLLRIDMSEYREAHQVARLLGAPPGFIGHDDGGQLGSLRARPAQVVLLDEIDKAHPDALLLLLQVLDDGRLTDGRGRELPFRRAIVVMTANLAAERERGAVGFGRRGDGEPDAGEDRLRAALAERLPAELVARIDRVLAFAPLDRDRARAIARRHVDVVAARVRAHGRRLADADAVAERVVDRLDDLRFGARHIERLVESEVGRALMPYGPAAAAPAPAAGDVLVDTLRHDVRAEGALLLVDIVDSTRMVTDLGDSYLSDRMGELVGCVESHRAADDLRFLKCTGDGLLALFSSVTAALAVARAPLISRPGTLRLRRLIHWGSMRLGVGGEPLGAEVHRLFRAEKLHESDRAEPDGPPLPPAGQPLLTGAAREHLPAELARDLFRIGRFRIRGFPEPLELWADPWDPDAG
ncbi:MAG TPA: AAA family ATPase, partial [Kofleriaceae bacterium]|nr:AAA family ATPase [Kofleriaceae bacterium]